ncbi:MAG TPA: histidinol-phosphate transaminase [Gammaproteobacteria bacterium]|nr:histidinol-phosphate transaminase [Gammaproteobacteria bacterium]
MTFDPITLAQPSIVSLTPYQPGKPLRELEREYGIEDAVKLASNENPLGPSPAAVQAIKAAVTELNRYPEGNAPDLKMALAQHHGVTMDQLVLGNGSNEILELLVRVFAGQGRSVVFSRYAFAVYPLVSLAVGATLIEVPDQRWGHDLEAMRAAITDDTRLVFIANPNNPTGTWSKADELRRFMRSLPTHVIAVVDQAYIEYVQEEEYPDCIDWLQAFPQLVLTRTFSKIYGLAGLRLGYSLSSAQLADLLNRARQPFNTNYLAQIAAVAALGDDEFVVRSVELNQREGRRVCAALTERGISYIPSVANFVSFQVEQAAVICEKLLQQGVIVRPMAGYKMPEYLRLTYGLSTENSRFLRALDQALL